MCVAGGGGRKSYSVFTPCHLHTCRFFVDPAVKDYIRGDEEEGVTAEQKAERAEFIKRLTDGGWVARAHTHMGTHTHGRTHTHGHTREHTHTHT